MHRVLRPAEGTRLEAGDLWGDRCGCPGENTWDWIKGVWGTDGNGQLQELGPAGLRDGPSVGVRNQGGKVGVHWGRVSRGPLWGTPEEVFREGVFDRR